ncbi:MAG: inositol monophosphatase family protein [Acidimicrobiales bacterium]
MSSFDPATDAAEVTALVQAASDRALDWFRSGRRHEQGAVGDKGGVSGFDPVTEADRAVEDEIRAGLSARFPDHAILGEEAGESGSADAAYRWVIDPIDGTRAFISGQPMWGTLVGLQHEGVPVAGWMHVPVVGETYVAAGGAAVLRDSAGQRTLAASAVAALADATMLCTHPTMFVTDDEQAAFARVADAVRLTRFSGDCVNYGLVASGDADLVVENQLQPYDVIPLIPIVEAAGGVITDREGRPPVRGGWAIAAATPELHAAALAALDG